MVGVSFFVDPNPAFDRMELLIVKGRMTENQTDLLLTLDPTDFLADG